MSGLDDIPVTVVEQAEATGQSWAVLQELAAMLDALLRTGETNSIDLRSLPLFPGDYERIRDTLGQGEVSATVNALGATTVRETAIPGVWWVVHRNSHEEVMTELLEVTFCPIIVQSQRGDVQSGLERLRERLPVDTALPASTPRF